MGPKDSRNQWMFCYFHRVRPAGFVAMLVLATLAGLDDRSNYPSRVEPRHRIVENSIPVATDLRPKFESPIQTFQPMVVTADVANDEPGHTGIGSTIERGNASADGWQYCLASSPGEKKVYISTPFAKITDLKLTQETFAESLAQTEHEAVQCPVSKYRGTIHTMRNVAIGFNRKAGNAVVNLAWEPFSVSADEDPIDVAIYTGNSSTVTSQKNTAWLYCFAQSYTEDKVYYSAPFAKNSSLHASEADFAKKLSQSRIKYDVVQCPNSIDQSSISAMRDHAIGFSQERGKTIISLASQS
jgi:hypothetical protein